MRLCLIRTVLNMFLITHLMKWMPMFQLNKTLASIKILNQQFEHYMYITSGQQAGNQVMEFILWVVTFPILKLPFCYLIIHVNEVLIWLIQSRGKFYVCNKIEQPRLYKKEWIIDWLDYFSKSFHFNLCITLFFDPTKWWKYPIF